MRDTGAASSTSEVREVSEVTNANATDASSFEGGGTAEITTSSSTVTNVGSTLTDAQRRRLDTQLADLPTDNPELSAVVDTARNTITSGDVAELPAHLRVLTGHAQNSVDGVLLRQRRDDGSPRFIVRPRDPSLAPFEVPADQAEQIGILEGRVQASLVDGELKLSSLEPKVPERFVAKVCEQDDKRGVMAGDTFVPFEKPSGNPAVGTVVQVDAADGKATLVDRMAGAGSPEAELYDIALAKGMDPTFSAEVRSEVAALMDAPGVGEKNLRDLSDKAFITIDNDDSMDLDQAMHIEKRPDGGFDLFYALSDASYYVKPGTALFDEALDRSSTYYFPGFSVPMLPRELSEGIVSLNPPKDDITDKQQAALKSGANVEQLLGQGFSERELCDMGVRRALVFKISVDKDGLNPKSEAFQGTIRSRAKLSYNGVQASHDGKVYDGTGQPEPNQDYSPTLKHLEELGELRITAAEKRGVVHYNRTNVKVKVDGGQHGFTLLDESRNEVEKWNEQISLLCNMEGAKMLKDAGAQGLANLQPIFRVHDAPPEGRIKGMQSVINGLVDSKGLPDSYRWDDKQESLASYIKRLPKGTDEEMRLFQGIQRQAIMTNVASEFDDEAKGHHGVGAEAYARFSSPMREMVGIFTHKELVEVLDGHGDKPANPQDLQLQDEVISSAMSAKKLQKKVNKDANRLAIDDLFERDVALPPDERPVRKGTVMGFDRGKMYVQLDSPPIEVKVYLRELRNATGERQDVDDSSAFVSDQHGNKLHLGEAIDIQCIGFDEERNRFILRPVVEQSGD
jgi:ribonuclease R